MQETGLSAVAKYAARGKQYLVLIRPMNEGLAMEQLNYPDELKSFSEVPLGDSEVKHEELALAIQLIEQAATEEFHPEKFEDEVRTRTLEQIERKVAGEDITTAPTEEPQTQIIDLMEALKASLAKGGAQVEEQKPAKRATGKKKAASKRKAPGA
jgi:DNA end-binding protein Ku